MEKHAKKFKAIESQVFLVKNSSTSSVCSNNLTYDYMSGVWKMLQSEREGEDFVISPKGYEFDVAKTKWVPKSDEVVKQVEESKQKCEEWLTKKCDYSLADKPAIQKCKLLPKIKRNRNKLT